MSRRRAPPTASARRRRGRDEIGLPQIATGPDRRHFAFTVVVPRQSFTLGEGERVVEKERLVVIDVHQDAQRIGAGKAYRLAAGSVEDLIARIERRREQAARSPFE